MIIRGALVISLTIVLALALYIPAAAGPEMFYATIHREVASDVEYWGDYHVTGVVERMLRWNQPASIPEVPQQGRIQSRSLASASKVIGKRMVDIRDRVLRIRYVQSLEALLLLASFRLSRVVSWLPSFGILLLACLSDGEIRRGIKSKQFVQHNPEIFSLCICCVIFLLCTLSVGLVAPIALTPLLTPCALVAIAILSGTALSNYHMNT